MRYLILILLNLPIVIMALTNILIKYKMRKITKRRFKIQLTFWAAVLICLVLSYPVYNHLVGNRVFESNSLTIMDIVQVTAIVYLVYSVSSARQRLERAERRFNDLHQELSIAISVNDIIKSDKS